jgi:hypothetical protein
MLADAAFSPLLGTTGEFWHNPLDLQEKTIISI